MADNLKKIKRMKVTGVDFDVDITHVGYVTGIDGTDYALKVDGEGNLYAENESTIPSPMTPPSTSGSTLAKLYINSFYCGGKDADEHTVNYCSHNFVELSNLTNNDINLKGLSLQYAINGTDWEVLPLEGVIRAGSTFVVRGAACSVYDSDVTKIKVDKYDMLWRDSNNDLIKFDSTASAKFYLTFNLGKYVSENPYNPSATNVKPDAIGYVDLVGVKGTGAPGGFEGTSDTDGNGPYYAGGGISNTKLFRKYYAMDPVKQATKAIGARVNAKDWCYIDLTKEDGELIPSIEVYRPMASAEHKNIFYNKTKLSETRPRIITCSFGRQATDNTAEGGNGATRCFNWVTKSTDNKYIWIRQRGAENWGEAHESFYAGDGRTGYTANTYNRILKEYTNNIVVIVNKFIISGLTAGVYEYIAGSKTNDGKPNLDRCTPVYSFTVRTDAEVNAGFKFVQTSDQQGFNWEEYRIWEAAAKCIEKERGNSLDFMINTGDMTQNGNRMGEWIDYFDGKTDYFNNMEEMATIGNNDLSLNCLYKLGNGEDNNKLWLENMTFFYTFEIDPENPPVFTGYDGNAYEIPSLYSFNYGKVHFMSVNTEIKKTAEEDANGYNFGTNHWGVFYPQIKQWCERDIAPYSANTNIWKIVYCHEMPFTILTPKITETTGAVKTIRDGGSNANDNNPSDNVFWLSEFCQTHGVKLCIGGHKHTEASSWQILENVKYENDVRTVDSMHPIIVVNNDATSDFYIGNYFVVGHGEDKGASALTEYNGYKYPNTWFNSETGALKSGYVNAVQMCTFKWENELPENTTPVLYAMSQATSYKHTSNKELPGLNIPWLRYYFPRKSYDAAKDSAKPDATQKFPFFTVWTINNTGITGEVRKVWGVFNSGGTFDVNFEYPDVKKGISSIDHTTPIHSINGITSMSDAAAETDTRIITIKK